MSGTLPPPLRLQIPQAKNPRDAATISRLIVLSNEIINAADGDAAVLPVLVRSVYEQEFLAVAHRLDRPRRYPELRDQHALQRISPRLRQTQVVVGSAHRIRVTFEQEPGSRAVAQQPLQGRCDLLNFWVLRASDVGRGGFEVDRLNIDGRSAAAQIGA